MRGKNHAAGVSCPVLHVKTSVIFRQIGITGVAKDRLDEIQVADQSSRREEVNLHSLLETDSGNLGTNNGPKQERDEGS
jgi:hypothetical protein